MVLVTVIMMDLLTGMEFDLLTPSFPQLQHYFHLSPFWVEALLSVTFFGYCFSLFFVGDLADRYGRKPIILVGLSIFIISCILCLSTHNYIFFLVARFFQGVGIAAPAVLSFLMISDFYTLKEQQFWIAILNGSMNFAVASAPVLGSYLTLQYHWQGNFIFLLVLGVIVLMMSAWCIPVYKPLQHKDHLKQWRYSDILKATPLLLLLMNLLFTFAPYWIFVGMTPLLFINEMGVALSHYGYYQGVVAFVFALGSIFCGFVIRHSDCDHGKMLRYALGMLIVSLFIIVSISLYQINHPLYITLGFIPFILAQIIPSIILYPVCLNYLPHAKGRISAMVQGGLMICSALGLQFAGYLYNGTFFYIGMTIATFIFVAIITLFFVIKKSIYY